MRTGTFVKEKMMNLKSCAQMIAMCSGACLCVDWSAHLFTLKSYTQIKVYTEFRLVDHITYISNPFGKAVSMSLS